jgi:hypothetical protein
MTRLRFKTDGSSLKNIDAAVRAASIPLLVRRGIRLFHEFDDYSGCSTQPVVHAITRSLSDHTS